MSLKKKTSIWRLKNEKHFFFLLPSYFKIAGFLVAITSIITLVFINYFKTDFQRIELINEILYSFIIVGLTFISFSKEKQEDERIANLRFRSFSFSVGLLVLLFIFQELMILLVDLFFTNNNHEAGIYDGYYIFIASLFITQLIYFYKFKSVL